MNILLGVDSSDASTKAAAFVGKLLGGRTWPDLKVTLVHVIESLPEYLVSRGSLQDATKELEAERLQEANALMEETTRLLTEAGIPGEQIEVRLLTRESLPEAKKVVAALALIDEMKSGRYDVICVGRRGASGAEGSFLGSVAEKILREARGKTVWVVD